MMLVNQKQEKDFGKVTSDKSLEGQLLIGHCSCTLVLEKGFCIDYGWDSSSKVVVEKREEGLLIRKARI